MSDDHAEPYQPRTGAPRAILFAVALAALSCAASPPPSPPTATSAAGIYYEEKLLPPPPELRLEIVSLDELTSPDGTTVTLNGVLRNGGGRATTSLRVTIDALDVDGNVITTLAAQPASTQVPPNGIVTFSAVTASHPAVRHYRVEAIGR